MALLYSWNTVTAAQNDADSPLTEDWGEAMRQNDYHLRQTVYGDGAGAFHTAVDGHKHTGSDSELVDLTGQIGQGELKTSTGSVSGSAASGASTNITMSVYSFFPNIYAQPGTAPGVHYVIGFGSDNADQIGRFVLYNEHSSSRNYNVRYRYVTASEGEQYAKFTDGEGEVVMKASFEDAPPEWEDIFTALAEDNSFTREDITKEEFDAISFD